MELKSKSLWIYETRKRGFLQIKTALPLIERSLLARAPEILIELMPAPGRNLTNKYIIIDEKKLPLKAIRCTGEKSVPRKIPDKKDLRKAIKKPDAGLTLSIA